MKNLKKKIKDAVYLLNYPYGLDKKWDDDCNNSFSTFLDYLTWILCIIVFGIPTISILTLLVQNYGK